MTKLVIHSGGLPQDSLVQFALVLLMSTTDD